MRFRVVEMLTMPDDTIDEAIETDVFALTPEQKMKIVSSLQEQEKLLP